MWTTTHPVQPSSNYHDQLRAVTTDEEVLWTTCHGSQGCTGILGAKLHHPFAAHNTPAAHVCCAGCGAKHAGVCDVIKCTT